MSKTLTLKARLKDQNEHYVWHDSHVLQNVFAALAKGKELTKAAMWLALSGKLQVEQETVELGKVLSEEVDGRKVRFLHMPEFQFEVSNKEARLLWKQIAKLTPEAFLGGGDQPAPTGTLQLFLMDLAAQLGEMWPPEMEEENED